jgi:CRISPR-associated protein Cmr4
MTTNLSYLYLLAPLHTGGTSQEGNLVGIARESHTDLPYIPSSTLRGRLRAATEEGERTALWGNTLENVMSGEDDNLKQGDLWVGDGSILWIPVPSLSHGVVWITCPLLLQRWVRFHGQRMTMPAAYSTNLAAKQAPVYLKDAILAATSLQDWPDWQTYVPQGAEAQSVQNVMVLPNQHCATLIQMSLWRQVKIKLDEHKTVDGGFRYEEAIPPDTLMYFPWGTTAQTNGLAAHSESVFVSLMDGMSVLQIGGQESLGRGFVQIWVSSAA